MKTLFVFPPILFIAGCVSNPPSNSQVAPERVVSIDEAISQIQSALANARARAVTPESKAGLLPQKATVVLELADTSKDTSTGEATIGVALPKVVELQGKTTVEMQSEGSMKNTITLELLNPYLAPSDTIAGKIAEKAKWKSMKDVEADSNSAQVYQAK